ncbi:tRNA uridine-5-carboxymethylaminomethyl(34) synthesis GTPase MnmE [Rhodoblastus acidophilus]|uniref:tRNA modification GTPase MnmE n=1 Tax=Candidatus Rhodoblastus alkanivorans TaxID=2954117 RepID=A0ABS9Z1E9_9HYPH|nr:tRNA uridine-5-carboxymethylaminomethyl(34) synthesis GTPase MnmE [Candidatus Rhodoblastus alkanivorans]MCI4679935.1 tRNA uridine-5-carboxymethylaminomethyl(34) synthesis GTPase MnmE [Candidatus Rhodoblastus alkanivorans]MCI4681490.1 tRNA uridine-5-carboxymethylaminomethyl(34) synthesis GTPase MnmE [Candidatus Rhodoblastus alkanivorans]
MLSALRQYDTIFALSSGVGKSAVSIIRISGSESRRILQSITSGRAEARLARLARIIDPETEDLVDVGIVIWFPGPNSFTGEDCVELHVHGSIAVVAKIFSILRKMAGVRSAEAGEFTRRAMENGKLDLIAAEALADLIDADTEAQRKLALVQAGGSLRALAERLREKLIELMADLEIGLDFADEVDSVGGICRRVQLELAAVELELAAVEAGYSNAERVRDGLNVLIAGPPNAGKSSLLNALARRDVAIVSEFAGTTRDLVEIRLDLNGFPVNLVDSAGIRATDDPIEREGVRRALVRAETADLVLWLCPMNEPHAAPPQDLDRRALWVLRTKADLGQVDGCPPSSGIETLAVSVQSGLHLEELIQALKTFAEKNMSVDSSIVVANERQWRAIVSARDAIQSARQKCLPEEVVAEELRRACFSLESLLGRIGVDDVLDSLFARFCIGK